MSNLKKIILLLFPLLILSGCSFSEETSQADTLVQQTYDALEKNDVSFIDSVIDASIKETSPAQEFVDHFTALEEQFGKVESVELVGKKLGIISHDDWNPVTETNEQTIGHEITLTYAVKRKDQKKDEIWSLFKSKGSDTIYIQGFESGYLEELAATARAIESEASKLVLSFYEALKISDYSQIGNFLSSDFLNMASAEQMIYSLQTQEEHFGPVLEQQLVEKVPTSSGEVRFLFDMKREKAIFQDEFIVSTDETNGKVLFDSFSTKKVVQK